MSSLKEKAFYVWFEPKDIKKEPRKVCQGKSCPLYDDSWGTMHCGYFGGGWCNHSEYGQVYDKLLVKFEDAQKEIEKIHRSNEKFKQKLKELEYLINRLPNVMYNALGDHTFYEENVKELKKKFKELLKENE
jgi:hypothetical protein